METAVKERPLLFSGPMVRAILRGDKTQTRRIVKHHPSDGGTCFVQQPDGSYWPYRSFDGESVDDGNGCEEPRPCPLGRAGDRLWVRETWVVAPDGDNAGGVVYRATDPDWSSYEGWKWRPSIFMKRPASRISLQITRIRVERLQDITQEDARAEGIADGGCGECGRSSFPSPCGCDSPSPDFRDSFCDLWGKINGPESWGENPWVWVIEFERVEAACG